MKVKKGNGIKVVKLTTSKTSFQEIDVFVTQHSKIHFDFFYREIRRYNIDRVFTDKRRYLNAVYVYILDELSVIFFIMWWLRK